MQFPERQQLFAIVFAFIMVTSMMSTGALASGGGADEIEQTEPSDFTSQYDVSENESDTDDELSTTSSGSENVSVETVPDPETGVYTATLEGNITELEADSADVFFQWRPVSEDGETEIRTTTVESVSTEGPFTESVTFLDPGTTYEFQAVADTENETVNGGFEEFTTDEGQDTDGFIEASDDVRLFNLFFKSTRTKVPDDETVGMQTGIPDVQLEVFGGTLDVYPGPGDKETLPVYQQSENIELTLSSTQLDRFSGSEVDLVAVETDTSEGLDAFSQISQIDELLNDENTDVDVFDTIELDDSDRDVTFENADDSGNYVFLVTNAGSVSVDDTGNVTTDDVRVVGLDFAAVQDDSSDVSTARPQYRPGENVTVETEAPFENENDITQAVILYDEDDLGSQDITAEIDDLEDIDPNNLTIESDIAAVDGVRQVEDGATFMGESLGERDETGIFSVDDIFSFVGGNIGENVDTEGGNVLNASMVAKADTGSEATFEVGTLENFTESEYSVIHVAESNDTGEIYTNKESVELTDELDPFITVDIDEETTDTQVASGDEIAVDATLQNIGNETAGEINERDDDDEVSIDLEINDEFEDRQGVILDPGEIRNVSFTYDTSEIDPGELEAKITAFEFPRDSEWRDAEDSITIDVVDDAFYNVDINEADSTLEVVEGDTAVVNTTIENSVGIDGGEQDIALTIDDEVVETQTVQLDGTDSTTIDFEWNTNESDAGTFDAVVASEDDDAETTITVAEQAEFTVDNLDPAEATVASGDEIDISANVTNVGEVTDEQTVELRIDGDVVDSRSIEIDGGNSTDITFSSVPIDLDPRPDDPYTHGIFTDDDEATGNLTVVEDLTAIDINFVSDTDVENELAFYEIDATVTSDAGEEAIQNITVDFGTDSANLSDADPAVELPGDQWVDIERVVRDDREFTITLAEPIQIGEDVESGEDIRVLVDPIINPDAGTYDLSVALFEDHVDAQSVAADSVEYTIASERTVELPDQALDRTVDDSELLVDNVSAETGDTLVITGYDSDGMYVDAPIVGSVDIDESVENETFVVDVDANGDDYVAHVIQDASTDSLEGGELSDASVNQVRATSDPTPIYALEAFAFEDEIITEERDYVLVEELEIAYDGDIGTDTVHINLREDDEGTPGLFTGISTTDLSVNESHEDFFIDILEPREADDTSDPDAVLLDETTDFFAEIGLGEAGVSDGEGERIPGQTPLLESATAETQDLDPIRDSATITVQEPADATVTIDEEDSVTEVNQTEIVEIVAVVENEGEAVADGAVEFELADSDGVQVDDGTQSISLDGGESTTVAFTYETTVDDRGEFNATVSSATDQDSVDVIINKPAEFDVSVTDPAENEEFAAGETINVTTEVENLGDVAGTQDLRLLADGAEVTSESVTIPANETDTVTIPFETDEDDIGTLNLTVVSDDTADTVNVTVLDTFFELELAEADDEATRGDDVEFVVDIENIGAAGTDTITVVDDDGTERVNESVTLETGASTTQVLSVPTFDDDNATVEFTIASSEDEVTTSVSLFDPADFEVEIDIDEPESGDRYNPEVDDLNGTVNVTNLGERTDTQTVTVEFDNEEIASQDVELDGSNSTNVTFNRTLTAADAGDRVIAAESDDNVAVETISVIQPGTFTVDIIEEESNLDVVAGQNGTVVAEITNVGETTVERTVTLTNVTESSDVEIASKDIKLGAGVDTDFEKEFETDATTPSELDLEVAAEDDDGDVVTATVEDRPSYFAVTIDELNPTEVDEPASGTTPVTVNGTVENLGTEGDNGTVTLTADGEEFATVSVDTDGDGNVTEPTFNETFDVERGDAPEVSVEAEAVRDDVTDGSDEETLDVTPLGELEVTIVEASNVSDLADQEFTPTINVTNVGEQDVNGTVELFFNGTSQTTASVSDLGDGDEATVIEPNDGFSINASDFDAGTFRLETQVRNDITNERDDRSTARVSIGDPAEFEVTSVTLDPTGPVDRGDDVTINATIENVGDVEGDASVFFEFGDTEVGIIDIDDIDGGDTVSEEVTYTTRSGEVGPDRPVTVGTADDELTEEITVFDDAEFEVELDADDEAVAGDTVTALATVENVGGLAGNTTNVRLLASGANTANPPAQNVELGEGDSTVVEFEVEPEAAGDLDLVAVTSDDFDTDTVDVGTPGEIELELRSVTDPVTDEDNFAVRVDVENIGDGPVDDQRLRLQFDGDLVTNETVSLPGGESDRITLNHSISRSIAEGSEEIADYAVLAPADSIEGQVTIEPEPQDPFFRVDSLDAESEVFNQSTDVAVNATVTNIGNLTGTQDITFEIGDVTETNESVQLGEGNSTDFTFEFDPTEVGETGDVEYAIASENQTETDNITIAEPDPATPEIVDVDVDDSVSQNEQLTVEADIENVGDLELAPGTEEITLTYADGDVSNTTTIDETIAAGDTGTVEITVEPPAEARAGVFEREITVETEAFDLGDTVTESVDVNFEGIGSGIDEAGTGGTVVVAPGEYDRRSTLVIDTEVTIEAADRGDAPVIGEPRRTDDVAFRITTDDVELSGLEFAGQNDGTAVEVQADTSLTNIRVEDWETGIAELDGTSEMLAVDVVDTDVGIVLDGNGDSSIEFSRVARADDTGVVVESDDNLIRTSRVVNSPIGIEILGEDNRVEQTVVRNSADYGVIVSDVPGDLPNDPSATLNFNAFESNGLSVFADNSSVDATQNWWGSLVPRQNVDFTARSNLNASDPLDSRTDSDLVVDDVDIDEPVVQDEPFEVTATINNTGTVDDLQQIELVDDGSAIADEDLRVNASETETVTLTYTPDVTDGDELDLSVRSLDDERVEGTIDINDPAAFELDGLTADDPVAAGQTLTVTADVENIGDVEGEVTVQLRDFEGDIVATQSDLAIDGNTTQPVNLAWDTDTGDIGEDDVTVEIVKDETVVDADTLNVEVTDAELVSIDLDLDETEIDEGEDTTATVTATFTDSTDDVTSEATITSDDTDVASVSGATITGESDGTATIQAEYSVNGETETDTVDLTVNDDGPTGSPSGGGGAPTPPEPDEPVDVEPPEPPADVTVDLDETVDFEFDGETGQTTATFSEQSAVDSVTFDFEIAGSVNARTLDRESDETGPAPGASAAVSQISVGDELRDQPATIGMRVSQERLAEIDADAEDLRINRFADGEWQGLDTEIVDETDTHVRIQAETPGFSYFAASAVSEPEAVASVSPETVTIDEEIDLSGSESTDRYGEIVAYDWSVDGETLSGETVTTAVDEPGEYTAELTVTNDAGETDTTTVDFTVTAVDDDDDDVPDDVDEEAFGTSAVAIIVLVIIAIFAAAGIAARRHKE